MPAKGADRINSTRKALILAGAASDKKALDIVTIRMRRMSGVCDYFVIASATSTTHARAIADNIVHVLKQKGERLNHAEGMEHASWILLDYGDVVGHVFLEKTRSFYELERLWGNMPQSRFKEGRPKRRPKKKKKRNAPRPRRKKTRRTPRKVR